MLPLPHEFAIGGVYLPPLLVAGVLAVIATVLTTRILNRYRMSRYVFYPPLVLLALAIIYTVVLGTFIIPG
jgi:type II secretory pathway component PulF